MASKFQNRLVGTVILVALGVIILPGLLDGKKKHYEDEFAAIPLVPKAGELEDNCPLVCFSASGGARMQEALMSLMQMAKTSAALAKMQERGLPYISVLTDPTMGGVSASLAMLGDINIAEPKALIGFAGPRVIEQTVREKLPPGFQRSEFLIEKGAIDMIVRRPEMRQTLASILSKLTNQPQPHFDEAAPVIEPEPQADA